MKQKQEKICPLPPRFPALEGLRVLLILVIVYFHGYPLFGSPEPGTVELYFRSYGGVLGNQGFFFLSGFLMAHRYRDRIRTGGLEFPGFLKKRLLAIYPLYFITVWVGVLLSLAWSGFDNVNFSSVTLDLLMLSTGWFGALTRYNSPLWFVSVLMQCYLLFYGLCYLARRTRRGDIYGFVGAVLLGLAMVLGIWQFPVANVQTGQGLLGFFSGCLLYYAYQGSTAAKRRREALAGALLLAGALALAAWKGMKVLDGGNGAMLFYTWLFAPGILLLCLECRAVIRVLGSRAFRWLGSLSLSIFMWHYLVYDFFYWGLYQRGNFFNSGPPLLRAGAYLAVLTPICLLSRELVERRLTAWLKKRVFPVPEEAPASGDTSLTPSR